MSSRALRKAQKLAEEQKVVKQAEEAENSRAEETEGEITPASKTNKSIYDILNQQEDVDQVEEGPEEADVEHATPLKSVEPAPSKSAKKKKKKKSKAKAKAANQNKDSAEIPKSTKDEDDIDAALRALDIKQVATTKKREENAKVEHPHTINPRLESVCKLLAVNTQNLHVLNEMRRLFGRDAIDADRAPVQQEARQRGRAQRGQRQQQDQNTGFSALSLRRNIFIQGKESWPRATTGGLGMEIVPHQPGLHRPTEGIVNYTFVHATNYQEVQTQYEIAVASMDPQRLVLLLHHNPYHIATLLQVSEIYKHERSHTESGDLLERALFTFGRTVHSTFAHNLSLGKARLDFNRPENREFYLTIWKYIQHLSMRGTWRTVFEWTKLLLSLSPEKDPYRMSMVLDQYALRANQAKAYLDLLDTKYLSDDNKIGSKWRISEHIDFSKSLCYLATSPTGKSRETLLKAIETHPWLAHRLFKELDLDPIPASLWSFHEAPSPRHKLLTEVYVSRAKDLWKTPEAKSLLQSVASTANPRESIAQFAAVGPYLFSINEARHIHLTENDNFMRLLAQMPEYRDITQDIGPRPSSDPFPPEGNIISYDPRAGIADQINDSPGEGIAQLERILAAIQRMRDRGLSEADIEAFVNGPGDGSLGDVAVNEEGLQGVGSVLDDVGSVLRARLAADDENYIDEDYIDEDYIDDDDDEDDYVEGEFDGPPDGYEGDSYDELLEGEDAVVVERVTTGLRGYFDPYTEVMRPGTERERRLQVEIETDEDDGSMPDLEDAGGGGVD